jgi:rare lipoprotein A
MKTWRWFLDVSDSKILGAIGLVGLFVYLIVIVNSRGVEINYLKQQVEDQKVQIQEVREERNNNPIIIAVPQIEYGIASWYGEPEHGQIRADGKVYNMYELHTAAHSDLPLGTTALVTNLKNGRSVIVQINDRLPKVWNKHGRIVDLSLAAGKEIGMIRDGLVKVELKVIITSEDMTPEMIHKKREILETIVQEESSDKK